MQVFEWHPSDPAVLVAGLANGQLVHMLSSASTQHPTSYSASTHSPTLNPIPRCSGTSARTWMVSRRAHVPGITGEARVSNRAVNKTVDNIDEMD